MDIAIWVRNPEKAFYYTADFSAEVGVEMKLPIGIQVLNEAPLPFKHHVFMRVNFSSPGMKI